MSEAAPLILIYFVILAKTAVDQTFRFVDAMRTSLRLLEAEQAQREADAIAAEARAEEERTRVERDRAITAKAEAARKREMIALAAQFEDSVVRVVGNVALAVEQLSAASKSLDAMVSNAAASAGSVAEQAIGSSDAASTLASAATQLSTAIAQIADQITAHAAASDRALALATSSEDGVQAMSREAARITDIVALIDDLTKQTNLLALNATIEAARAGEAGRGFAVVAGEVKSLARRAGDATGEVRQQVQHITEGIADTVAGIQNVAREIDAVARIAAGIAASVVQQRQATAEIDCEAEIVARNAQDMRNRMSQMASGAGNAGSVTRGLSKTAEALKAEAGALRSATDQFLGHLRAA